MAVAAIPIVLAVVSAAAAGASAMQQASAQKAQAKAQSQTADYNAQVARNQAEVQRQNSEIAKQQGLIEQERIRDRGMKVLGQQEAAAGASGVTMSGSALDVFDESNSTLQEDIMQSRFNTEMRAWNFEQGATNAMSQSQLLSSQAANAAASGKSISPALGVASAVASGATQAYGSYSANNPSFQKTSYYASSPSTVSSYNGGKNPIDTLYGR